MILNCNSCEKKFVVPDQAITASGRTVQCGSCGNKWKQFPITNELGKTAVVKKIKIEKKLDRKKIVNQKRKIVKKTREINLYSPEYLAKKHGISLDENIKKPLTLTKDKISFGFYNSLLLFFVFIIFFSKGLHFFQGFIIENLPITEFYINYFFESIRNMFEIWKNLISNY